jgi:hypothetical protein
MKKLFTLVIAIALLALAASAFAVEADLTFGAQETGTGGYTYATAIQTAVTKGDPEIQISLATISSGNVSSPVLIENGDADVVLSNSAPAKWAAETGIESANVPACPSIRCIAGGLGNDFVNVMFTKKFCDASGITTLEELVAKEQPVKLVIKTNGSFGELTAERVFGVFGIDINNPPAWLTVEKTSGSAIKDGLADDLYDMTIDHISAGQANTTELCLTHEMVDVQLADETLAKLCEQGYDYTTVPAGTWNGQDVDIKTVGSAQNIIVSEDMEDEVAYALAKAVCENKADLVNASASMSAFDPATAGSLAKTGCQLHPGAAKYYEEMGYAFK